MSKPRKSNLGWGSPISPLTTARCSGCGNGNATTPTSSSSSDNIPNISNNHSGEFSISSGNIPSGRSTPTRNLGHRRSDSGNTPLIYSGGNASSSSSSASSGGGGIALPAGNICPSGKIVTGMATPTSPGKNVLGFGNANYGHGSIVQGGIGSKLSGGSSGKGGGDDAVKKALMSYDLEEVKEVGNDQYRKQKFVVALSLYDRAIALSPNNAVCRSNRAAALISLGRLGEAVSECDEAVKLDPRFARAHQRLFNLYLRLGQVENARQHLCVSGKQPDTGDMQMLHKVEKHLKRCFEFRSIGDWKTALREGSAAIDAGADSSPQLVACKAESHLKLHEFEKADSCRSSIPKIEPYPPSCAKSKFFGMLSEAYVFYVVAQVEMAFGRFGNAVTAAEKAGKIDTKDMLVGKMLANVTVVKIACDRGNDLFSDNRFMLAVKAYEEGLKHDPSNSVLYYKRAACWSNLGEWGKSVQDCTKALEINPSYTSALQLRAQSYEKLQTCDNSARNYDLLRRERPRVAPKKLNEEDSQNLKVGYEAKEVSDLKSAKNSSG